MDDMLDTILELTTSLTAHNLLRLDSQVSKLAHDLSSAGWAHQSGSLEDISLSLGETGDTSARIPFQAHTDTDIDKQMTIVADAQHPDGDSGDEKKHLKEGDDAVQENFEPLATAALCKGVEPPAAEPRSDILSSISEELKKLNGAKAKLEEDTQGLDREWKRLASKRDELQTDIAEFKARQAQHEKAMQQNKLRCTIPEVQSIQISKSAGPVRLKQATTAQQEPQVQVNIQQVIISPQVIQVQLNAEPVLPENSARRPRSPRDCFADLDCCMSPRGRSSG
eukprot:gnl/TRDRNA2_/TRDRNA2_162694_c0_seq1.p1 gnl/TRDRNA2_/TRDRNA2_162694_c0~~gnl/TRDRNA2_/TRDRNA2_162694_c0_seq1.p1  ORF type:complete len:322 (+),score=51.60 gnl/TRDRNA2_/TRDRNA2_162694_c0_seq1:126-968(+)